MTKLRVLFMMVALAVLAAACSSNKSDSNPTPNSGSPKYALQLAAGGQNVGLGSSVSLAPQIVDLNGNIVTAPATISYSVEPSSLGTVVNGRFVAGSTPGTGKVTARMTFEGVEYVSVVPVAVAPAASQFHVVPSAILWTTGAGNIQLESVYFGTSAPGAISYSVTSGSNVVSVSSSGNVSFLANGEATIRVSTTISGQAVTVDVPVMVVGLPTVVLPVARVSCTPNPVILFNGETQQLTPKTYNSNNVETTGETFTYTVITTDSANGVPDPCVSVSTSGLVTPRHTGEATIVVTARGVSTQVTVEVLPDKVLLNSPFFKTLGTDPFGGSSDTEFTATVSAYTVDRAAYRSKDYNNMLRPATLPAGLQWMKPTFPGFPQLNDLFDIVDLVNPTNSNVLVRKKSFSSVGSTFVFSYDPNDLVWTEPGVTAVTCIP